MFNFLTKNQANKQPLFKEYRRYIKKSDVVIQQILEEFVTEKILINTGRLMGITEGNTLIFQAESEMSFVNDFTLFEYRVAGQNFLEIYKEKAENLSTEEAEIIENALLSFTSLFKIIEIEPDKGLLRLNDLLNKDKEFQLLNLNLSKTAKPGLLIFTRLIPFHDFYTTSGMFAGFAPQSDKYLLKRYKVMKKKVKSEVDSIQKFIALFKLNRIEGLETKTVDF